MIFEKNNLSFERNQWDIGNTPVVTVKYASVFSALSTATMTDMPVCSLFVSNVYVWYCNNYNIIEQKYLTNQVTYYNNSYTCLWLDSLTLVQKYLALSNIVCSITSWKLQHRIVNLPSQNAYHHNMNTTARNKYNSSQWTTSSILFFRCVLACKRKRKKLSINTQRRGNI